MPSIDSVNIKPTYNSEDFLNDSNTLRLFLVSCNFCYGDINNLDLFLREILNLDINFVLRQVCHDVIKDFFEISSLKHLHFNSHTIQLILNIVIKEFDSCIFFFNSSVATANISIERVKKSVISKLKRSELCAMFES